MNKLVDLIRRVTRAEPLSLGFGAAQRKTEPTMALVALVGDRWTERAAEAISAGADALLLNASPAKQELAQARSAAGERPCGLLAPEAGAEEIAGLRQAKLDFVVVERQASASALLEEEIALLLHIHDELTDAQLRMLDGAPLAAVSVERPDGSFTIERQMELQRVRSLSRKPLLVAVQAAVDQQELLALREAGVVLTALDMAPEDATDTLRRLRSLIDDLPPRRTRRDDRPSVSLTGGSVVEVTEGEDEDDEEAE